MATTVGREDSAAEMRGVVETALADERRHEEWTERSAKAA